MPYKDPEKQKAAQRAWYQARKQQTYERSRAKRLANRAWLDEQKRQPCLDCGDSFPPYVMEYHHRDPATKVAAVTLLLITRSRQTVSNEIAKCDLLCANCHRIREYRNQV